MTGYLRTLTLVLCLQLPVSCAFLIPPPESLDQQISLWLKEKKFDRIESSFKQIDSRQEKYKNILKRKPEIAREKKQYIEQTSKQAQTLKTKQKWQQSIDLYKLALGNIENEPRLSKELKQLIDQRDQQISILRKNLLIKNARAQVSYDDIYNRLIQLVPDDSAANRDMQQHNETKTDLSIKLESCGAQAFKDNLMQLAYDCYSVSNLIAPTKQKQYWVERTSKRLINEKNHKLYADLLDQYNTAYNNKQYNQAKVQLTKILAINPDHKQATQLLDKLESEIHRLISGKISMGKELYSNQKINEALIIWRQAQKLSPDSEELTQLIQRAEKVSKKIQSLEHKQ